MLSTRWLHASLVLGLCLFAHGAAAREIPLASAGVRDEVSWTRPADVHALPGRPAQCACLSPADEAFDGGVVWRGPTAELQFETIVGLLAPVLWYSPDEPLKVEGDLPLPHPHPCDVPSTLGVVYYQATRLRLRGAERVDLPVERDPRFFEKVDSFTVRYYFYYRRDFGLRPHPHDLEVMEMHVSLRRNTDGCYEVRLTRAIGFAHATDWYSNELQVERDTRLPMTVLVEEGKHASCPDRNADGMYTPGYDVNRRVNDAWGVRDVLGSGFLISSGFRSSMVKLRPAETRVLPPGTPESCAAESGRSSMPAPERSMGRYELRSASGIEACEAIGPDRDRLVGMMRGHRFGAEFQPDQYQYEFVQELREPLTGTSGLLPDISARWDGGPGGAFLLRGLDLREAYIIPRFTWVGRSVSAEALFTRSAAQFLSWYMSSGVAREYVRDDRSGRSRPDWSFVGETGTKVRVRLSGRRRIFALGYEFAGVRLGMRFSGFDTVRRIRLIAEVGAGVW